MAVIFGNWRMGVSLQGLMAEFGALLRIGNDPAKSYQGISGVAATAQGIVADKVNDAIEDYLTNNSEIGTDSLDRSAVANTATIAIPTDLRRQDVRRVYYKNTGANGNWDLVQLTFLDRIRLSQTPPQYLNGSVTAQYPTFWTWSETEALIVLIPTPAVAVDYTIEYRTEPDVITQANVASPSAVSLDWIPTRHKKVLAYYVARELAPMIPAAVSRLSEFAASYADALKTACDETRNQIAGSQLSGLTQHLGGQLISTTTLWPWNNQCGSGPWIGQ